MGSARRDRLHRDDALVHRLVRQLETPDAVADPADSRGAGALLAVDDDRSAFDGDPGVLQSDVLDVAGASDGDEQHRRLKPLLARVAAHCHSHTSLVALEGGRVERHPHQAVDAARLEPLLQLAADGLVLERHQARRHLHERDVAARAAPEGRELHPDRSGAENDRAGRHAVEEERVVAGEQLTAVALHAGDLPRP